LCGPGSPAHAAVTAPAGPGGAPAAGASPDGRTHLLGSGATARTTARFPPVPSARRTPPLRPGPPTLGRLASGAPSREPAARLGTGCRRTSGPTRPPPQNRHRAALPLPPHSDGGRSERRSARRSPPSTATPAVAPVASPFHPC